MISLKICCSKVFVLPKNIYYAEILEIVDASNEMWWLLSLQNWRYKTGSG
ncbi:hypothetical protein DSUL_100211 [Desulfovibrionales bacterium]